MQFISLGVRSIIGKEVMDALPAILSGIWLLINCMEPDQLGNGSLKIKEYWHKKSSGLEVIIEDILIFLYLKMLFVLLSS